MTSPQTGREGGPLKGDERWQGGGTLFLVEVTSLQKLFWYLKIYRYFLIKQSFCKNRVRLGFYQFSFLGFS